MEGGAFLLVVHGWGWKMVAKNEEKRGQAQVVEVNFQD